MIIEAFKHTRKYQSVKNFYRQKSNTVEGV